MFFLLKFFHMKVPLDVSKLSMTVVMERSEKRLLVSRNDTQYFPAPFYRQESIKNICGSKC